MGLGGPAAAVAGSVGEERAAFRVHGGVSVGMPVDVTVKMPVGAWVGTVNVGITVSVGDAVGMVALMFGRNDTGRTTNLGAEGNRDCGYEVC